MMMEITNDAIRRRMERDVEASKAKHTPAPWSMKRRRLDTVNGGEVASLNGPKAQWLGELRMNSDEDEANANLIIAAPDLLKACKEMLKMWAGNRPMFDVQKMVEAAVAKASNA